MGRNNGDQRGRGGLARIMGGVMARRVAGVVLIAAGVTAGSLFVVPDRGSPVPVALSTPAPLVAIPPLPIPQLLGQDPACSNATSPFVPTVVSIPGVAAKIPVLALRRGRDGLPAVPPISSRGKTQMAFDLDNGIRPGDSRGNALLNAHTWPDGSALGNTLLAELHEGDRIVVHGQHGKLCYRVTDRFEASATDPAVLDRYYAERGKPQIALAVCSGQRLGPGLWTKRTVWFASPVA